MRTTFLRLFIVSLMCAALHTASLAGKDDLPAFKPVRVDAQLSSKAVRPGGQIALTLRFRNDGNSPAEGSYPVFVHLEHPGRDCRRIVLQRDHMPAIPTCSWEPGKEIIDGAYVLDFPRDAAEGIYHLHVGVFNDERRWSDQYVAEIKVSKDAPDLPSVPPEMSRQEIDRRARLLDGRITASVILEDETLRFAISLKKGAWRLRDKRSDEVWHSSPFHEGLGVVRLTNGKRTIVTPLEVVELLVSEGRRINVVCRPEMKGVDATVGVWIELQAEGRGLRFNWSPDGSGEWRVESVRLLDDALWATDTQKGCLAVPYRLGILVPADEGLPCLQRYLAYGNYQSYSMAMAGAVKNGSAVLVWWDDPYTTLEVERSWPDAPNVPGRGMVSISLEQSRSARSFTIRPLGKGGCAEIARAYRDVARERGFLSTLKDKIGANPGVEQIIGAADLKPFVLSRRAPGTRYNQTDQEQVDSGYSFDECAQIAEHFSRDLGIDRAMMVLAGWIHRGYDNQHPDILPAAPECGGDEALADCSERVRGLGYLFGLHDNYQDMYRDAPSWDESFVMKGADGSLRLGGVWAGGQAYLTCSQRAIELAKRDKNLPAVKRLFDPTIYFIDTVFAAAPYECFDPEHPLTLSDDITWKRRLSEYARKTFGLFGSEEGQEWGVPCADYFEGLLSHRTQRAEHEIIVPLFEMVYGDCISLYTHQGDRLSASRPECVLDHILYAEMPVYQFGGHLYFKQQGAAGGQDFSFADLDGSALNETDRFIKNTYEILSPLCRLTAHTPLASHEFLTEDRKVERTRFGDVTITVNYGEKPYRAGSAVLPKYGFLIESPSYVGFHATEYAGQVLEQPTMLIARSLDGKPLAESADVHIHQAFGDRKAVRALPIADDQHRR